MRDPSIQEELGLITLVHMPSKTSVALVPSLLNVSPSARHHFISRVTPGGSLIVRGEDFPP